MSYIGRGYHMYACTGVFFNFHLLGPGPVLGFHLGHIVES